MLFSRPKINGLSRMFKWEQWPFYITYSPMLFVWAYYWIRSGHFWFFSNVNPTMYFSGFEGENKEEMFQQVPREYSPKASYVQPNEKFDCVLKKMCCADLQFPVAVKPDVGTKGLLFRKIENKEQLAAYHALLPFRYLIQELITLPLELSIFYVRYPGEEKGTITGLIAKKYLQVTGNGRSTLMQLIDKHPKAFMMADEHKRKYNPMLNTIIPCNEIFYLNESGNHNRGATFINLEHEIDDELQNTIDKINIESKHFYYGRYDIKTASLKDLKKGKNIFILEFNGVGSEPNHIYDIGLSYAQALKIISRHWRYMFEIGRINYKKGIDYIPFRKGYKMVKASKKNTKTMQELHLQCTI